MNRKQMNDHCKTVEYDVRRKSPWCLTPGVPVKEHDRTTACDAVTLWVIAIGDIVGWDAFPRRVRQSWLAALWRLGLVEANEFFKYMDSALLHSLYFEDFRSRMNSVAVGDRKTLLHPFLHYVYTFLNSYDEETRIDALKRLRVAILFISHLTLDSDETEEASFQKWYANLQRVGEVSTLPSKHMQMWVRKQNLPSPWSKFKPRVNTGSVAELGHATKGSHAKRRPLTEYEKWLHINTLAVRWYCRKCGVRCPDWALAATNRISRVIAVPKGIGEKRIISPEPCALMFIQQGLARAFDFRKTKLARHVNLADQSVNSEMARKGSEHGRYSCFDLSSASDSVRYNFVVSLFEQEPEWRKAFQLCRSTHSWIPKWKMELPNKHFAPMGSAMCFPTETFVFCAIVEEAFRVYNLGRKSKIPADYTVYGDDIVVDARVERILYKLLEYFGFKVNKDKTFLSQDPLFREACGGHWYLGADVSPIRLGRKFKSLSAESPSGYLEVVDLCNRAKCLLPSVRYWCLQSLLSSGHPVNFTHACDDTGAVQTECEMFSREEAYSMILYADGLLTTDYQCNYYKRYAIVCETDSQAYELCRDYGINAIVDATYFRQKRKNKKLKWRKTAKDISVSLLPYSGEIMLFKWFIESQKSDEDEYYLPLEQQIQLLYWEPAIDFKSVWTRSLVPRGCDLRKLLQIG